MLLLLGLSDFSENGRNQVKSALLNLYSPDDSTFKIELISILAWFEGSKLLFWSVFRPSILFISFYFGPISINEFFKFGPFWKPKCYILMNIRYSNFYTFYFLKVTIKIWILQHIFFVKLLFEPWTIFA